VSVLLLRSLIQPDTSDLHPEGDFSVYIEIPLLTVAVLPSTPEQTQQYYLIRPRPFPSEDSTTHQSPITRPFDSIMYEILSRKIKKRKMTGLLPNVVM
jgi:hypothetical protein